MKELPKWAAREEAYAKTVCAAAQRYREQLMGGEMDNDRPFVVELSEHDLRHVRIILKRWAIEQKDWSQVRCAVGIYERINGQLSEETKAILSGPPKPERDRRASTSQKK